MGELLISQIFIKRNSYNNNALECEARGLAHLSNELQKINSPLKTPTIIQASKSELQLQNIYTQTGTTSQMTLLGQELAKLHQIRQKEFGYHEDNFIGLNPQRNSLSIDWGVFFVENRLYFQIALINNSTIRSRFEMILDQHSPKIIDFLNESCQFPSLLHGDLWSGNVLFDKKSVYLIDPAVYYGHNEADIAMTQLFGGFSKAFYEAYNEVFKLSSNYEQNRMIYNLYHYLNHYNLFGNSYLGSCEEGIKFIERL